jgi:hypothetical protein
MSGISLHWAMASGKKVQQWGIDCFSIGLLCRVARFFMVQKNN